MNLGEERVSVMAAAEKSEVIFVAVKCLYNVMFMKKKVYCCVHSWFHPNFCPVWSLYGSCWKVNVGCLIGWLHKRLYLDLEFIELSAVFRRMVYKNAGWKEQRGKIGSTIRVSARNTKRWYKPQELSELFEKQYQFNIWHIPRVFPRI